MSDVRCTLEPGGTGRYDSGDDPMIATRNFTRSVPGLGRFSLRSLRIPEDMPVVHAWVRRDYARYWGMQTLSLVEVEAAYRKIVAPEHCRAFLGLHADRPAFLVERYRALPDRIARYYDARPGDYGMHLLVAPAETPISQFTWRVFCFVMEFMFSDPAVARVVVEPDIDNQKIAALNQRAGFVSQRTLRLPEKTALLAFCTRAQHATALAREKHEMKMPHPISPEQLVSHLQPDIWSLVNARHLRKVLSEFAHELLIVPRLEGEAGDYGQYVLSGDQPNVEYRFRARVLGLEHWHIVPDSVEKCVDGATVPLDSASFIIELSKSLGIEAGVLPTYLEEILSTLYGSAYKYSSQRASAAELVSADFQVVETSMTDGHPVFVANNGRIGFDALDYRSYAPEAANPVRLIWVAAHESRATFACIDGLSYGELLSRELGEETLAAFAERLRENGVEPARYVYLPVHPWQWQNKLASIFAPDIATHKLIFLGQSQDRYLAQQSVRTFFNVTHPDRCYVKTSLSVLNMGFMRGLSPYYMRTTPAINQWVHALVEADEHLRECGFGVLREVASVGYENAHYAAAVAGDSPYKKMLAALWRESPVARLAPGERLMTMASLLHRDRDHVALLPELIASSGQTVDSWLRCYFRCYLSPILHCFYAHDLVFMPHGENVILLLRNGVPAKAFMKDIGEEVAILNPAAILPEKVQRIAVKVPEELKVLSIFTDVFDCIFRFIADVLVEHAAYPESRFWELVAECVLDYEAAHPALAAKFGRYDLFAAQFSRSCLNRLQLGNNQQMIDLTDPAKNLKFAGTLKNPIAPFNKARRSTGR